MYDCSTSTGRIKPFLLRRTKEQVATELPPKTEIIHWVELNDAQRDVLRNHAPGHGQEGPR